MATTLTSGVNSLQLVIDPPLEDDLVTIRDDLVATRVWVSTTNGFTPGPSNLVYDGPGLSITIPGLIAGTTYYVRYALISSVDVSVVTTSAQMSATVSTLNITGELTNSPVVIAADNSGTVAGGIFNTAATNGTFRVFESGVEKTTGAGVVYSVQGTPTGGLSISINSSTGVYSVTALTGDSGSATLRAVYQGVNIDKVYTISKSKQGTIGVSAVSGYLTNEAHVVVSEPTGLGYSLTNAGGTFKVFNGTTDVTTSSTFSITGGTDAGTTWTRTLNGLTFTINETTGVYSLSGASWTSDSESFTVNALFSGTTITKQYVISKSKTGGGALSISYSKSNVSVPVDSAGNETWTGSGGTLVIFEGSTKLTLSTQGQSATFPAGTSLYNLDITRVSGDTLTEPASITGTVDATISDWAGNLTTATVYRITARIVTSTNIQRTLTVDVYISPNLQGNTGLGSINVVLSNPTMALPSDKDGNNVIYTGSGTTIRVFEGNTELNYDGAGTTANTWTLTTSASNITVGSTTGTGAFATIGVASAMTADNATITYTITGRRADNSTFSTSRIQSFAKAKGIVGTTGTGINLVLPQYSAFLDNVLPTIANSVGASTNTLDKTVGLNVDTFANTQSLRTTSSDASAPFDDSIVLSSGTTSYNINIAPNKYYIISAYVRCSIASGFVRLAMRTGNAGGSLYQSNQITTSGTANTWTRVWAVLNLSADPSTSCNIRLDNENTQGTNVWWDNIMIEELVGIPPSGFAFPNANPTAILPSVYEYPTLGVVAFDRIRTGTLQAGQTITVGTPTTADGGITITSGASAGQDRIEVSVSSVPRVTVGYLGSTGVFGIQVRDASSNILLDSTELMAIRGSQSNDSYNLGSTTTNPAFASSASGTGNLAIGEFALYSNAADSVTATSTRDFNTAIGQNALRRVSTGANNIGIGHDAGSYISTGDNNIAIGYLAVRGSTTNRLEGKNNIGIGTQCLEEAWSAQSNIAIGFYSGQKVSTGTSNILIGDSAGRYITTGYENVFVGTNTGVNTVSAYRNVALGFSAASNYNGRDSIFIGSGVATLLTSGIESIFIGTNVLTTNNNVGTNLNILIGSYILPSNTNSVLGNVMIGNGVGFNYSAKLTNNTIFGNNSLNSSITTATGDITQNVILGNGSAPSIASNSVGQGSYNVIVGSDSAAGLTTGSSNIIIGYSAGTGITTGVNNIIIGASAGSAAPANLDRAILLGDDGSGLSDNAIAFTTNGTRRLSYNPTGNVWDSTGSIRYDNRGTLLFTGSSSYPIVVNNSGTGAPNGGRLAAAFYTENQGISTTASSSTNFIISSYSHYTGNNSAGANINQDNFTYMSVANGVTVNNHIASRINAYRNSLTLGLEDLGTITDTYGLRIFGGHNSTRVGTTQAPITTNLYVLDNQILAATGLITAARAQTTDISSATSGITIYGNTTSGSNQITDVTVNQPVDGTWARATATITVTHTAHGRATNDKIWVSVTSDAAAIPKAEYTITVVDANTFTFTGVNAGGTTGTLSYALVRDTNELDSFSVGAYMTATRFPPGTTISSKSGRTFTMSANSNTTGTKAGISYFGITGNVFGHYINMNSHPNITGLYLGDGSSTNIYTSLGINNTANTRLGGAIYTTGIKTITASLDLTAIDTTTNTDNWRLYHIIICNSTSAITITLPDASVCIGIVYRIVNINSGDVIISRSGTTDGIFGQYNAVVLNSATSITVTSATARYFELTSVATNAWMLNG